MSKVHYGLPGYRPACGLDPDVAANSGITTRKAIVTCVPCKNTHKWRTDWYDSQPVGSTTRRLNPYPDVKVEPPTLPRLLVLTFTKGEDVDYAKPPPALVRLDDRRMRGLVAQWAVGRINHMLGQGWTLVAIEDEEARP